MMSLDVWIFRSHMSGCLFWWWPSFTGSCCNVWVGQRTDDCYVPSQLLSSLPGDQRKTTRPFLIGSAKTKWLFGAWLKGKGSPYSTTERRVPELIPVLGSQPAGGVSHKPGGRPPLLSTRPAVTPATLKRAATNFAAWWTEAQWVWTVCPRLLPKPDSVATAIWTKALLHLSPAC